jgi:hypothetical protein
MDFFRELRRRNVYKVAIAYVVVTWLIMQVVTQTFPFFEIPNWGIRLVILLLIAGVPIAAVIGWAFELTPEGIMRTSEMEIEAAGRPGAQSRNRAWLYLRGSRSSRCRRRISHLGRCTEKPAEQRKRSGSLPRRRRSWRPCEQGATIALSCVLRCSNAMLR